MDPTRDSHRSDTTSRTISATPERIYEAFADGETLMKWLPPEGMSGRALDYDFREGGSYRIELTYDAPSSSSGKTTSKSDISKGRFLELIPGQVIKQSVEFESDNESFAGNMTMSWVLEPLPEGTNVTVTADHVPIGIRQEDHDMGMNASLDNLARFVEQS